jgi:hypothetical protein
MLIALNKCLELVVYRPSGIVTDQATGAIFDLRIFECSIHYFSEKTFGFCARADRF